MIDEDVPILGFVFRKIDERMRIPNELNTCKLFPGKLQRNFHLNKLMKHFEHD